MMRVKVSTSSTVEFYALRDPQHLAPISTGTALTTTRPEPGPDEFALTPIDPITRLTRECNTLRLKLATAERRERISHHGTRTAPASARTPPPGRFTLAIDGARDAARTHIHDEVMKLADRCKALEKALRDMQDGLRERDREIDALRREREQLVAERDEERRRSGSYARARTISDSGDDYSGGEYSGYYSSRGQRERSRRHSRRADDIPAGPLMTLEAEHYARTRSLDVFLTKTDSWSGAQIIQAVDDLNAEIGQFAAVATESCSFAKRSGARTKTPGLDDGCTPWLGPALSRILATRDHSQDPILVQLALQASLAICCSRTLTLFCVGFPSKLDALLSRIHAHMQTTEPQATSSRWRSLTHRSIRMLYPGLEEYAVSELVTTMVRWSTAVFTLSGSGHAPAADLQLRRIAEAVYKLARVTREEILSTTFEVLTVDGDAPFEPGRMANKMREGDEDQSPVRGGYGYHGAYATQDAGKVLCTTELGLRCVTRREPRGGRGESTAEAEFESRMLLLPKVVLDTVMEVIERG